MKNVFLLIFLNASTSRNYLLFMRTSRMSWGLCRFSTRLCRKHGLPQSIKWCLLRFICGTNNHRDPSSLFLVYNPKALTCCFSCRWILFFPPSLGCLFLCKWSLHIRCRNYLLFNLLEGVLYQFQLIFILFYRRPGCVMIWCKFILHPEFGNHSQWVIRPSETETKLHLL